MTVTLTYDATLSRVQIAATALAAADIATVERSTDQIRWTTVRGSTGLTVTAGALASPLYDYEFVSGVANYYRVRGIETPAITYVAVGAVATANNASVTPALPAGIVVGDLLVCLASIRNSGAGSVNVPAGWTVMRQSGNMSLLGRRYVAGDAAPVVTFAGGVLNADTMAQVAAFRRADLVPVTGIDQLNGSAQNVAFPALTVPANNLAILMYGWKQDDWTSVAVLAGATEIAEPTTTTGDDASMVWDYVIQTAKANIAVGSFVVTGGAAAISRGAVVAVQHAPFLNEQITNVTPTLTAVWLKSISRPFLNVIISLGGSDFTADRSGRGAVHDALGRSLPIAVTDVRGSRRYALTIRTTDAAQAQTLDYLLASGDVLYLHAPASKVVPAGGVYVRVADTQERRVAVAGELRHWTVPVTEVAPPGPDIGYALSTWASVLAAYATWADVLAANPTWADLLARLGSPSEVIVP